MWGSFFARPATLTLSRQGIGLSHFGGSRKTQKTTTIIKFLETVEHLIFTILFWDAFCASSGLQYCLRRALRRARCREDATLWLTRQGLGLRYLRSLMGGSGVARHWPFWGPWKNKVFEQHKVQRKSEILKNHQIPSVKPPSWPAQGLLQRLCLSLWEHSFVVLCREAFSGCVLGCIALFCSFF